MNADNYKFWGFISYSHQDRHWGEWLHRAIESYRVPARLAGRQGSHGVVPPKLFPVFRDRADLPTAGGLDVELARALEASRCLVLVCSRASAASRWVNEEVLRFKQMGRESRILCLIVDGEPNATDAGRPEQECFPHALRFRLGADGQMGDEPVEPLATDLRNTADGRDNARLKIIAGLLGVGFDELKRRDLQTRNRRLAALSVISTVVAALTIVLAVQAVLAQRAAENSRQQGEDLIGFMLGELRGKLEPLGKLDILDDVGDKAMSYFDKLDNRNLSEAALAARAKALRQIGEVRLQQGRAADAAEAWDAALAVDQQMTARHPNNPDTIFEQGQTEFWVGESARRADQLDRAEAHFQNYRTLSQRLVDIDPGNPKWQLEVAYSSQGLGSLAFQRGRYDEALTFLRKGADIARTLAEGHPKDLEISAELAQCLSWEGTTLQQLDRRPEAIATLKEQVALARSHSQAQPDDLRLRSKLAAALSALALAVLSSGDADQAWDIATEGKQIADALIANDPSNQSYQLSSAAHRFVLASVQMLRGDLPSGERSIDASLDIFRRLYDANPQQASVRDFLVRALQVRFDLALAQGHSVLAQKAAADATELSGSQVPDQRDARLDYARAHLLELELAKREAGDPGAGMAEQVSAVRNALGIYDEKLASAEIASLRARLEVLGGDAAAGTTEIASLLSSSYRPTDLVEFFSRHCPGSPALPPGQTCPSAIRQP